ncbi:MAG: hypothetical protein MJ236_03000 [Clostridia bacterium]|nr:hypothetical protein [Clostridia bacterium]
MRKKLVYLLALWPIIEALIVIFAISIDVQWGVLVRPIYEFSIAGTLLVILSVFCTGFIGYLFGKCNIKVYISALVANIIPIVCTIVYFIAFVIGNGDVEIFELIGLFGNGMFSTISIIIPDLATTVLEMPVALIIRIATFVVGYAFSSVNLKKI